MQAPAILEPSTAPRANAPTQHYQLSDGEPKAAYLTLKGITSINEIIRVTT